MVIVAKGKERLFDTDGGVAYVVELDVALNKYTVKAHGMGHATLGIFKSRQEAINCLLRIASALGSGGKYMFIDPADKPEEVPWYEDDDRQ